ncbi:hypothetical protein ANN_12059 [Periplaneta americana]|uniref:Reverse transcriptase domain-containing protein n=1 Tax=Periplaneta americana TaxID=6978 RepID=A0ABQ8T7H9_PERAM|nr:hypothetical protein ANN_12059 [Periplaneta americana]
MEFPVTNERIPNLTGKQSDGITVFRIPPMTSLMLHRCRTGAINLQSRHDSHRSFQQFCSLFRCNVTSLMPPDRLSAFNRGDLSSVRVSVVKEFVMVKILEKQWEYKGTVHQLFLDFKKAYDSVKKEVLYDILTEFGIPKKLVRLIKMCLNETYSRVRIVGLFPYCVIQLKTAMDDNEEFELYRVTSIFSYFLRVWSKFHYRMSTEAGPKRKRYSRRNDMDSVSLFLTRLVPNFTILCQQRPDRKENGIADEMTRTAFPYF